MSLIENVRAADRLQKEVQAEAPGDVTVHVDAADDRQYAVWVGGSIPCSRPSAPCEGSVKRSRRNRTHKDSILLSSVHHSTAQLMVSIIIYFKGPHYSLLPSGLPPSLPAREDGTGERPGRAIMICVSLF